MPLRFIRFLCLLARFLVCPGAARAITVVIVLSERSAGYQDVAKAIAGELERSGVASNEVAQVTGSEWVNGDAAYSAARLVVTLGAEALKQVLSRESQIPVVAALVPRIGYDRIVREGTRRLPAHLTAIFLDQPLGRRADLVRLILPEAKRVGVLWGPESVVTQAGMAQALQSRGLTMVSSVVANPAGLFSGLKSVLDDADVLMAVADPQVYSGSTIANILLATYRARIPVVAFSPAYVKAGAMIAIYATPNQIGTQAAGLVRVWLQGGTLPAPQYPNDFEISVNDHVARSLGLNLDVRVLTEKLQNGAKRP